MSRLLCLCLIFLLIGAPTLAIRAEPAQWEPVADGIEYREFELPDPNNVFVARMERNDPNVTLESSIAKGRLSGGTETVKGMAARYDQALNFWGGSYTPITWGLRNQVVVAINGSYYDPETGIPQGGQVQSGWYAKRFDDLGGGSGFGWTLGRSAFIGECVNHKPEKQVITDVDSGYSWQISGVNVKRGEDELILYTPQYDSSTGTDKKGVEVLVELTRPTLIVPQPAFVTGYVRQVEVGKGDASLPYDYAVLSASGVLTESLVTQLEVGDEVHISQEITSYESDCVTPRSVGWTKTYASVQGAFLFLREGEIQQFEDPGANERNPRTAIAFNEEYIYFIVVDGRDTRHSVGMTMEELGIFARDTLSATWGISQDGGGSSTMVINGEVVNNVYCNNVYCMGNYYTYLPLVSRGVRGNTLMHAQEAGQSLAATGYERPVANGMMMVVVLPMAQSVKFYPGETVTTKAETELRLGPGTNNATLAMIPSGKSGVVLDDMNDLNGVLSKGSYWWKVDFGTLGVGWIKEEMVLGRQTYDIFSWEH
jgi:hypothetical protein